HRRGQGLPLLLQPLLTRVGARRSFTRGRDAARGRGPFTLRAGFTFSLDLDCSLAFHARSLHFLMFILLAIQPLQKLPNLFQRDQLLIGEVAILVSLEALDGQEDSLQPGRVEFTPGNWHVSLLSRRLPGEPSMSCAP